MVKFLTQHTNFTNFFSELQENEVFMYSYLDFKWEDVVKIAEENRIKIEYIKKGTQDYKKYGECAAKVTGISGKVYEYKTASDETIKIEAKNEANARLKLLDYLFAKNYVRLNKNV